MFLVIFQHLKDKFWNFIFYKFIFIFGVLNVQTVDEVVMWCLWFSALVFLHLMVQLCKDRFEYVSTLNHHIYSYVLGLSPVISIPDESCLTVLVCSLCLLRHFFYFFLHHALHLRIKQPMT